jgi:hypothetical protein
MLLPFALALAFLAPSAPVPKILPTVGSAPRIVELKPNSDGKVLITIRREDKRTITTTPPNGGPALEREILTFRILLVELSDVKELQIFTADGKPVDTKVALAKLEDGAIVVLTTDGKKVDANFLRVFKDDTLVLVSPELVGTVRTLGPVEKAVK